MAMFQRNDPSQLPMPQRTQDIVAEARERLAASGGKASQLPAMIQRVTEEYRYRDNQQLNSRDARNAMQMPNDMEAYIDRVLGMSGMAEGGSANGGVEGATYAQTPANAPVPGGRDTSDLDPEQSQKADQIIEQGEADGWSLGQILAGLAGVGGLYAAGRYLFNRYGSGQNTPTGDAARVAASSVDETIDAVDGKQSRALVPYDPGVSPEADPQQAQVADGKTARLAPPHKQLTGPNAPADSSAQAQIEGRGEQLALPAPQKALPAPSSAIDESIEATLGQDDIEQIIRQRVEQGGMPGSTQPRYSGGVGDGSARGNELDINSEEGRAILMDRVSKLPPRDAVRMLREAGVELDENMLRTIIESSNTVRGLNDRANDIAGGVARTITRGVAR